MLLAPGRDWCAVYKVVSRLVVRGDVGAEERSVASVSSVESVQPFVCGARARARRALGVERSVIVIPRSPSPSLRTGSATRDLQTVVILSAAKDLLLVKSSTQMNADLRRFTQIKERERSF